MEVVEGLNSQMERSRAERHRVSALRLVYTLNVAVGEEPAMKREFALNGSQPVGLLLGMAGTGKSVLAMHLASQALKQGVPHVCVALPPELVVGDSRKASPMDLAPVLFRNLRSEFGLRIDARAVAPIDDLRTVCADLPRGSLVIADEVTGMVASRNVARGWIDWSDREGHFLLMATQVIEDLFDDQVATAKRSAQSKVGMVISGRHAHGYAFSQRAPRLAGVAVRGAATLVYPPRGKREFFVTAVGLAGGGLLSVPLFGMDGRGN